MLEHGDYKIRRLGSIIFVKLFGSFNEFGISAELDSERKAIEKLKGKTFLMLVDASEAEGYTPEAYRHLLHFNQWLSKQNMEAKALVFKNSTLMLLEDKLIDSKTSQCVKVFDNLSEAIVWLENKL